MEQTLHSIWIQQVDAVEMQRSRLAALHTPWAPQSHRGSPRRTRRNPTRDHGDHRSQDLVGNRALHQSGPAGETCRRCYGQAQKV